MNSHIKGLLLQASQNLFAGDWKSVAKSLLDANKGMSQFDLHYRAYLRAILQGQSTVQLMKFDGAQSAQQDLINEYGRLPKFASHGWKYVKSPEDTKVVFQLRAEINGAIRKVLIQSAKMSPTEAGKFVTRVEHNVREIEKLLEDVLEGT